MIGQSQGRNTDLSEKHHNLEAKYGIKTEIKVQRTAEEEAKITEKMDISPDDLRSATPSSPHAKAGQTPNDKNKKKKNRKKNKNNINSTTNQSGKKIQF